jgi:hypothetical protein
MLRDLSFLDASIAIVVNKLEFLSISFDKIYSWIINTFQAKADQIKEGHTCHVIRSSTSLLNQSAAKSLTDVLSIHLLYFYRAVEVILPLTLHSAAEESRILLTNTCKSESFFCGSAASPS